MAGLLTSTGTNIFRRFARALLCALPIAVVNVASPVISFSLAATDPDPALREIATASLEQLLTMTVTSVSRVPEELRKVPAAVFVLTAEDIRRSGATSVPEVLRHVPGVNVARVDANKWAVSIRGFNGRAANKLLVMVDGRTIYNPLLSGTLWETRDLMLEQVERIEVIRGPGGSTWGANAVNGVINIIRKHAKDTQGTSITAGGGTEERAFASVIQGAELSEGTFARAYGKYYNRDKGYRPGVLSDDSYGGKGGFRLDSEVTKNNSYTIEAEGYSGEHDGVSQLDNVDAAGSSIQGIWRYAFSERSRLETQVFYDYGYLDTGVITEKRHIGELDALHELSLSDRFDIVSAFQYRLTSDEIGNTAIVGVQPQERDDSLLSGSVQGRYSIIPEVLDARLGVKLEHNDYSDFEVQPDAGITWAVNPNHILWAKVSHAVRTPSRLENDFFIVLPGEQSPAFVGNRDLEAEELAAYELGHRILAGANVYIDATTFFNDYDELITVEGNTVNNTVQGETYGGELAITYRATPWWELQTAYSYIHLKLSKKPSAEIDDTVVFALEGTSPEHQASLWSRFDIGSGWQIDLGVRYVDRLPLPHVSSYVVADARVAYRMTDNLELAVVGQNLFDRRHFEQGTASASQVQEGVYGKVTLTF